MVSRTTLGVITNIIILLYFCSRRDVSTRQNQGLEISPRPGSIVVRKTAVRKPSPPAAGGALYSEIMREQRGRKETPCGLGCQGSKLPPLGRHLQLKDELSLPQIRVRLGEEMAGERWLEMCWLGWGWWSPEDTWHPQSRETCGDALSWGHGPLEDTQQWGAITHSGAELERPGDVAPWRTRGHDTHGAVTQLQQRCRSTLSWGHGSLEDTWPWHP